MTFWTVNYFVKRPRFRHNSVFVLCVHVSWEEVLRMTNTFTSAEQQAFVFNVFWVNTSWPTHQNESHSVATSSLFFKFPRPAFRISCNHCRWPRWRTPVAEENEVWHERGKRPQRWKLLKWSKNKEYKKKKTWRWGQPKHCFLVEHGWFFLLNSFIFIR